MPERITIVGAGPGGYIGAIRAAQLGAEVTLIEREAVGGTCLNRGCIPTKSLKASADAMALAGRLSEFGLVLEGRVRPDMPAIQARKDKVVQTLVTGVKKILDSYKVRLVLGSAEVLAPDRVRVETKGGPPLEILGDKLILAAGSRPADLPALKTDGSRILNSDQALGLETVPEDVLIVGGGVIGVEFAFIFSQLGSRVTVVEALDRVVGLPGVDPDSSRVLEREMKKNKIALHLNRTVFRVESEGENRVRAVLGPSPVLANPTERDRRETVLSAERILVSIGRRPAADGLGLDRLGVETDERGWVKADDHMETSVAGVYAIGDLLGPSRIMLAHVAVAEALVAAENCLGKKRRMDYDAVPSGIFTTPEMADVGLTEPEARAKGLDVRADTFLFRALGKPQAMGEIAGQVKIVSEVPGGKLLGVHIIGPHATDLIAEATLALRLGATAGDLAETIHVHPSLSETVMEAAHAAVDAPLHRPAK